MLPGSDFPGNRTVAWTAETAFFALYLASAGDHARSAAILSWLAAHRTSLGALPEQVNAHGRPVSVAPLAWTDAVVLLALIAQRQPLRIPRCRRPEPHEPGAAPARRRPRPARRSIGFCVSAWVGSEVRGSCRRPGRRGRQRTRRSQAERTTMSAQYPRFRSILDEFVPYKPGKTPLAPDGRSYKLSSNESPFGPLPSVVKVIAEAAGDINRYPDNGSAELTEAIADRFAVPAAHVAVGCGSVGVTQQLLEAVAEPGAEVALRLAVVRGLPVPVRPGRRDVGAGAAARRDPRPGRDGGRDHRPDPADLRLQPEQPDRHRGAPGRARRSSWTGCPTTAWSCSTRPTASTSATRTCRTGSACTATGPTWPCCAPSPRPTAWPGCGSASWSRTSRWPPRCARPCCPSRVNALAQAAAIASLAAEAELLERVDAVVKERDRVRDELLGQGWTVPPTEANFVWLRARRRHRGLRRGLRPRRGQRPAVRRARAPGCRSVIPRPTTRSSRSRRRTRAATDSRISH